MPTGRTRPRWRRCASPANQEGVRAARVAAPAEESRDGRDDPAQIHHLFVTPPRGAQAAAARSPHRSRSGRRRGAARPAPSIAERCARRLREAAARRSARLRCTAAD